MNTKALKICVEALSLPRQARAELAHRLLVSLEDKLSKAEIEEAWKKLSRQRTESRSTDGAITARDAKQTAREVRERSIQ